MKKLLLFALPVCVLYSCTKDFKEEIKRPGKNSWFVNDKTYTAFGFILDTFNVMTGYDLKKGMIAVKFSRKPTMDGDYVVRRKADEMDELSIMIVDSTTGKTYLSMDDDGQRVKTPQFAHVTVNGGSVSVSFDHIWIKDVASEDKAKVSGNLN